MEPLHRKRLRLCGTLLLALAFLALLYLWPEIVILIGLGFALWHTVRYLRSLSDSKPSFWKKTWEWMKEVWDSISGIG